MIRPAKWGWNAIVLAVCGLVIGIAAILAIGFMAFSAVRSALQTLADEMDSGVDYARAVWRYWSK